MSSAPALAAALVLAASPGPAAAAAPADGSHDFDFDIGTWQTHSSRLMHPLSGASDWVEMDGVTVVTPIWGGRANLAEYRAEGSAGLTELLALRIYNPVSQQWRIDFATPNVGVLGVVPGVGAFHDGRVDFYDLESINGRTVLVRFSLWGVTHQEARSEQAFSVDGGRTWEVNWKTRYTRLGP